MLYRLGCILQQTLDLCIQCMTQLLGLLQKILCITFMYRLDGNPRRSWRKQYVGSRTPFTLTIEGSFARHVIALTL